MALVIPSSTLALASAHELALSLDHPIIGWENLASWSSISEDANYPSSNLNNPATHLKWKAAIPTACPPATYIYIDSIIPRTNVNDPTEIDYVAIARHNLGTIGCAITIGYYLNDSPDNWVALVASTIPADDTPILFRFTAQGLTNISIRLAQHDTQSPPVEITPEIAVAYAGKLLVLPRRLYQGLTPINYGRTAKVTNGRSEAGQFLGRVVMQEFVKDTVPLSLIDPSYYLTYIDPFLAASKEEPFFFAYRPLSHPESLGYCHMTNDPMPINEAPHGLIGMQLEMTGIV